MTAVVAVAQAGDIKGVVIDKEMNEPLMGASVRIAGTRIGTTADINGNFHLRGLKKGTYTLEVSYVSFFPQKLTLQVPAKGDVAVKVEMSADDKQLNEVTVTARKNLELERALLAERQNAVLSIENLGASEMSIKGISNVQEGVKKLTGISIAEAGQLIVRGLGDRYSSTTLNGLPIASPNPDNKLIPLDIFPSSAVQNITVSKVYEASAFADYSGAHVDISTKEGGTKDFSTYPSVPAVRWGRSLATSIRWIGRIRCSRLLLWTGRPWICRFPITGSTVAIIISSPPHSK